MPRSPYLSAALAHGPVIMDGAMGTELNRLGHGIGAAEWVASTLDLAPHVAALHRAYAHAGAQLHIANTFATGRHVLAALGQEARFEAVNRAAVDICRTAVGDGWIAGSISTYVIGSDRANLPRGSALASNVGDQAALLADAGCDMIALEMLFDVETTIDMITAAATAALPVSVGLTVESAPDGITLRGEFAGRTGSGLMLETALPQITAAMPPDAILTIMHAQFPDTDAALPVVRRHWDGPVGVYPNSGRFRPPNLWENDAASTPEDFATRALAWRDAAFVGGCCGIGPDHIQAFASALTGKRKAANASDCKATSAGDP
ncbi:MAG: homocysteine S-methyltransferase family protein [Pseudomonadota bacterium]